MDRLTRNYNINIVEGDITQIAADALMTGINSGKMWYGGVDGAIERVANDHYHMQARTEELNDLDVIVAKGKSSIHKGQFDNVIFVVDDLKSPLNQVIYKGLEAASNEGYSNILIPAMRMGVAAGIIEKSPQEAVEKLALGIEDFCMGNFNGTSLKDITFVVYDDPNTKKYLEVGLN